MFKHAECFKAYDDYNFDIYVYAFAYLQASEFGQTSSWFVDVKIFAGDDDDCSGFFDGPYTYEIDVCGRVDQFATDSDVSRIHIHICI